MTASLGSAAVISFTAADFLNENQMSTTNTLVEAVNFGDGSTNQDLNGITFTAAGASSANLSGQGGTAAFAADKYNPTIHTITGVDAAKGDALFDYFFFGSGLGSNLVTLSGLTPGQGYEFQLLMVEDRPGTTKPNNTIEVSQADSGAPTTGLLDFSSANVQLVTGTFTADAITQGFDISVQPDAEGDNITLMAYQLRAVPEPSAAALLGRGGLALILRRRK